MFMEHVCRHTRDLRLFCLCGRHVYFCSGFLVGFNSESARTYFKRYSDIVSIEPVNSLLFIQNLTIERT